MTLKRLMKNPEKPGDWGMLPLVCLPLREVGGHPHYSRMRISRQWKKENFGRARKGFNRSDVIRRKQKIR
jgi:hypothetical protein